MALPVNTAGNSWITFTQNSTVLALSLPEPYTVVYRARRPEEYLTCLGLGTRRIGVTWYQIGSASIQIARSDNNDIIRIVQWDTTYPGIIDQHTFEFFSSFRFGITSQSFVYGLTDVTSSRFGLIMNNVSQSDNVLSLEPYNPPSGTVFWGDVWFNPTSSFGNTGIRFINVDAYGTSSQYVLGTIGDHVSSSFQYEPHYSSSRTRPTGSLLYINSIATNDWFVSVGDSGWRNVIWDGGIWQTGSGSVDVYGPNKNFFVPSGSVTASGYYGGDFRLRSGSFFVLGGNIQPESSVNIFRGDLTILDISASVGIYGNDGLVNFDAARVTGSLRNGFINTVLVGNGPPTALPTIQWAQGTLYINSITGGAFLRISGSWEDFGNNGALIDGGFY
jgi:hypothetical protein